MPSKEGTPQLAVPSALPGPFGTGGNLMSRFVSHIAEVLVLHVKIRSDHKVSVLEPAFVSGRMFTPGIT